MMHVLAECDVRGHLGHTRAGGYTQETDRNKPVGLCVLVSF